MTRLIPAVDVELFEKAFYAWQAAIHESPEDGTAAGIGAIFHAVCLDEDNPELFKAVCGRVLLLGDLIHARRKRVTKHGGFPSTWLEVAATVPLECPKTFNTSLFTWPSGVRADSRHS